MPFSMKTLDFLFENRLHDSREWFEQHKAEYQKYVIAPMRELVRELTPAMLQIDKQFTTEPRVDKTICRIWRDTRYSKDKSLYRDTMWIIFKRGKMHGTDNPGFYFEITGSGYNHGCGFYHASTGYMDTLRQMILCGDKTFMSALRAFEGQSVYHMEGERYKRPHFPDQPENLRLWLERRNISFDAHSDDADLLFSDRLAQSLARELMLLRPIYRFLTAAALQEQQNEAARAAAAIG